MPGPVFLTDQNSVAISPTNPLPTTGGTGTSANQVQGTSAAAAADDGSNPVKMGAVVNTAPVNTKVNGTRTNLEVGSAGALPVTIFAQNSTTSAGIGNQSADAQASQAALSVNAFGFGFNGATSDRIRTITGAVAAGSAGTGTLAVERGGTLFSQITTATTTAVKGTPGILHRVCINTPIAAATIKIYNAATATGTPITITCPSTITGESPFFVDYDIYFGTAITVVTSGLTDVTVTYR